MAVILERAKILTPTEKFQQGTVIVGDDGKIEFVGPLDLAPKVTGNRLNLENYSIMPGLIDIHVHGGHGITFGEGNLAAGLAEYSNWVVRFGVTGFLTTITASTQEGLVEKIKALVVEFKKGLPGASGLGIHLEGPFMNVEKKGAQNPAWIRNPSLEEAKRYLKVGEGWIKQITIAPELPGAYQVAKLFAEAGVVVAIGHSTADYQTAVEAIESHWTLITHIFNAQTGLHHREPGIVGAVMASENVTAELIADKVHVHPGAMKVLLKCIGADRIVLVTDAMEAAGLPDGVYHLLGEKIYVSDGKATQEDGTIASSTAVLNQCVRNMNQAVGVPLMDAVKMATINPARVIGEGNRRGSIEVGKVADLIAVDDDLNVHLTMVNGKIVYS
ncbi:MAG: N-acetylglucosamine-6-phosphate deacetylase [Chloroflexota bacterium]|nr:N-acetylglucosamine-6-phosphate deacetylase [Chloroflexota bacterium]